MQARYRIFAAVRVRDIGRQILSASAIRAARRNGIVCLTVLLCLSTVIVMTTIDGYRTDGSTPLTNADFAAGFSGWSTSETGVTVEPGSPTTLRLENTDPQHNVFLSQTIDDPQRFDAMRLSVELKTASVRSGPRPSNRARVVLASYDTKGEGLWHHHHILAALSGSRDWQNYDQVFLIGSDVATLRLLLQLPEATGVFDVRNLRLEPVTETFAHQLARHILMALWAALLLWIALVLLRITLRRPAVAAVLVLALLILFGTLSPKQYEAALEETILSSLAPHSNETAGSQIDFPSSPDDVATIADARDPVTQPDPRTPTGEPFNGFFPGKVAHVALFALLGLVLTTLWRQSALSILAGTLLLAAVGSELLQLFAPGRDSSLVDASLNAAGALAGALLGRAMSRFIGRASARSA